MENIPEILAALGFFGAVFILPVVFLLLRHQRAMTELFHRSGDEATKQRLEQLEQEVRQLRAGWTAQIIANDDASRLRRSISDAPKIDSSC